jgi:hypothetical protein
VKSPQLAKSRAHAGYLTFQLGRERRAAVPSE